ncbi:hypothetical protein EYD45_05195 [Hyunsoonleella flava]|uniref:Uncharacterized protein n=1 Tax=Hyunsoonleella flava TaxID=2527939 RepID=A0A4Q9FFR0_9FLAO|nr:hypothetical protein [Hyunsoonleella flava]TBN04660.1 hypothetical protein EYD45_05195 [Hyunsoonleella flava]
MRTQIKKVSHLVLLVAIVAGAFSCQVEPIQEELAIEENLSSKKKKKKGSTSESEYIFSSEKCMPRNSTTLYAGKNIEVGNVSVKVNDIYYDITYSITNKDYYLVATNLSVVNDPSEFPLNKKGNPRKGKFEFGDDMLDGITTITYSVPMSKGTYIAAHAVVQKNGYGSKKRRKSAWGDGCDFPGNNWATYFQFFAPDEW